MKQVKGVLLILLALPFMGGCQRPASTPGAASNQISAKGSSTGGGSFGNESSLIILRWAADELAAEIRNSSPELYQNLPKGWAQTKLADVIANVEPTRKDLETYQIPEISRYGVRLMFNYDHRDDGSPFITATKLFIDAYASYEVNTKPKQDFYYIIGEVKLKLAHEAAHLMGLGLSKETDMSEARTFAQDLLDAFDTDNLECMPTSPPPLEIYTSEVVAQAGDGSDAVPYEDRVKSFLSRATRVYVINRPTGKAAVPTNIAHQCDETLTPGDHVNEVLCDDNPGLRSSSGEISVFAPKSYDQKFNTPAVRTVIQGGPRVYGYEGGYFDWNLIDLRKAVLTDHGYKSNYNPQTDSELHFEDYMDFKVSSTASTLTYDSYPPEDQQSWEFTRSQGQSQIALQFAGGKITSANLTLLKSYNLRVEDRSPNNIHIVVPLTCVRSFKPVPAIHASTAAK